MVENQTRTLTGDGIARNTSRSYLTIRGLHRQPFPRSSERGPIEDLHHAGKGGDQRGFPRSSERGPIEDLRLLVRAEVQYAYFRAHLSAAPLKTMRRYSDLGRRLEFPRSSERGPIEDCFTKAVGGSEKQISALI